MQNGVFSRTEWGGNTGGSNNWITGGQIYMDASHSHSYSGNTTTSGNGNGGNLQPYLTVYYWVRTY